MDQVADAYFDPLERTRELDARISEFQGHIDEQRQRVTELRQITRDRAVATYYESTNNYRAYNRAGPAYGAYQFLKPTWNLTANRAGRGDLVGLDPRQASEYDQDDMAWTLYQWRGKRPWSVDPC